MSVHYTKFHVLRAAKALCAKPQSMCQVDGRQCLSHNMKLGENILRRANMAVRGKQFSPCSIF